MWLAKYKVGSRIVIKVDIEIFPWDEEDGVAAGDHGEVVDVDPETGDLTILMDRLIPALVDRKNYLFVRAEHLCRQLKLETGESSLSRFAQSAAKPFGVAFAASIAFMVMIAAGNIDRETHHRAYENRFPSSTAIADGCVWPSTKMPAK